MSSLTLYEAADELRTLFDTLDGLDDPAELAEFEKEMEPALKRALQKVESFVAFLRHLDSQIELCAGEIARIKAHQQRFETMQERLEDYAIRAMQASGVKSLGSPTAKLRIAQNPPSVVIENEDQVPAKCKTVTIKLRAELWPRLIDIATRIDKAVDWNDHLARGKVETSRTEIATALKAGETVPGARLERKVRLVVE